MSGFVVISRNQALHAALCTLHSACSIRQGSPSRLSDFLRLAQTAALSSAKRSATAAAQPACNCLPAHTDDANWEVATLNSLPADHLDHLTQWPTYPPCNSPLGLDVNVLRARVCIADSHRHSRLYRRSLKLALDWSVHRYLWRGQALYIRSLFEANANIREPRQQRVSSIPPSPPSPTGPLQAFLHCDHPMLSLRHNHSLWNTVH
jgi:hypothetical protein